MRVPTPEDFRELGSRGLVERPTAAVERFSPELVDRRSGSGRHRRERREREAGGSLLSGRPHDGDVQFGSGRLGPVALAGLLLLAGCGGVASSGAGGGGDAGATLTPVEVPEETASPRPLATELPPGMGPDGVEDPFVLARAHTEALEGRSYTVRSVVTMRYPNGTLRGRGRTVARVGADRSRFHVVHVTLGPRPPFRPVREGAVRTPGRSAFWSDGRRFLWSVTRPGGTVYRSIPPGEYEPEESGVLDRWRGRADAGGEDVYLVTNAVRTRVTAGSENGSGSGSEGALRIVSTGRASAGSVEESHSIGAAFDHPLGVEFSTVTSVELTATVEPSGFVREYRFAYAVVDEDERVRVVRRVTYSAVGETTIPRPEWYGRTVDDAANGTDAAANGTVTPA
jgi:hypothetical protein